MQRLGLTPDVERVDVIAQSASSSCAPAFSERTSTPSRTLTSGASLATRFRPSYTAFTSRTSYCLYAATERGKLSATCRSISGREPRVHVRGRPLDRRDVLDVLGDRLARRIEQREHRARPRHSGCVVEQDAESSRPRTMFFDGSVRSTRSTSFSGRVASMLAPRASTSCDCASSSNSAVSIEIGVVGDMRASEPPTISAQLASKFLAQRAVWKRRRRSRAGPRARRGASPREGSSSRRATGCGRSARAWRRAARAHVAGRKVQVVVVEENGSLRIVVQLDNDSFGEQAVDRLVVAATPRGTPRRGRAAGRVPTARAG